MEKLLIIVSTIIWTLCRADEGSCNCGLVNNPSPSSNNRILGDHPVQKNKYPWMARLRKRGYGYGYMDMDHMCGGSLINSRWILTAAHCVESRYGEDMQHSDIEVLLGDHDINKKDGQKIRMDVSEIIKHPDYHSFYVHHDIALLKLSTDVDFTNDDLSHIRPICLPDNVSQDYTGWDAIVAGWGYTDLENIASILQEINGTVVANRLCRNVWNETTMSDDKLCVQHPTGQKPCGGDSGGPLITKQPNSDGVTAGQNYELIGVVSYGTRECTDNGRYKEVYARVTKHMNWIEETIRLSGYIICPRI